VLADGFNLQLYVDEAFPGRPLQPDTPLGRAEMRMFVASLEALVVVLQSEGGRATFNRRAYKRMDDLFIAIDEQLRSSPAPWLDGERAGMRDISFLPLLSGLETLETTFPASLEALSAYWQRAMKYEPFQKTNFRSAVLQGRR